jgi:hypothetical protein
MSVLLVFAFCSLWLCSLDYAKAIHFNERNYHTVPSTIPLHGITSGRIVYDFEEDIQPGDSVEVVYKYNSGVARWDSAIKGFRLIVRYDTTRYGVLLTGPNWFMTTQRYPTLFWLNDTHYTFKRVYDAVPMLRVRWYNYDSLKPQYECDTFRGYWLNKQP